MKKNNIFNKFNMRAREEDKQFVIIKNKEEIKDLQNILANKKITLEKEERTIIDLILLLEQINKKLGGI